MITAAGVLLGLAAIAIVWRLIVGPTLGDRVIATDALLVTAMCAVLLVVASSDSSTGLAAVYVVALLGFIATGVLARYLQRRGDS